MPERVCDSCGKKKDVGGGKTCENGHFLCKACGDIIDIEIECPNAKRIEAGGHRIDEVHGYFKGVCSSCLKNNGGD